MKNTLQNSETLRKFQNYLIFTIQNSHFYFILAKEIECNAIVDKA